MSQHPALLQTDVVNSTRLSQQLGDAAMAALWEAHDRVARDLLRQWRGREIDKSDGFLLLFPDTGDAAAFATAYHRAIAALRVPLQARAGLHVGPLITRENSPTDVAWGAKALEVEGLAKPTTARVMSLALGGQTLLTAEARQALGHTRWPLQSHGHWRLQGLEEPIELFELGDDGAPSQPPPDTAKGWRVLRQNDLWVPMRELRHSLPAELDGFIGRRDAMRELTQRFEAGARVVSLLGIAGTGKSRLAQRFGWTWLGDYPGGVWFCDLSQARTLDGIAHAVAQGLDVPLGAAEPIAQLGSAIAGRGTCLVILDNFEQVAQHAGATISFWLSRAAAARFIVTTREVLSLPGEHVMALAPLTAAESEALFLRRAAAARPDFRLHLDDTAAIAALVKLLDGLPLAIELAAARVRVMPPRTLLLRMRERFKVLASTGGRSDRQATLRAAFDWSWDLMSQAERTALAQLSVFEGGFTLAAAEAVLDLSPCPDAPWPIDVLQALVGKSFVRQVSDHRFDLLGSVKEYADEHLRLPGRFAGSGEAALASARARHSRYFSQLAEADALAGGCIDIDNLVVACDRAVIVGDEQPAVGALTNAWAALKLRGPFGTAATLAARVRDIPGLGASCRAKVEWVAGSAHHMLGQSGLAHACFDAGLALARAARDRLREASLLLAIGEEQTIHGRIEEAHAHLRESLSLARAEGDKTLQINAMNSLAALTNDIGHADEARATYGDALLLARQLGDRRWQGGLLGNLGTLHYGQGRLRDAVDHYEQALTLSHEFGDRQWEGNTRCNLGLVHHDEGRHAEAQTQFEAALGLARDMGHVRLEWPVLCNLGLLADVQGEPEKACHRHEQALAIAHEIGDTRAEGEIRGHLGLVLAKLHRAVDARQCFDTADSLLSTAPARTVHGLLLCRRAHAEWLLGDAVAARALLALAEEIAVGAGVTPRSEMAQCLAVTRRLLS